MSSQTLTDRSTTLVPATTPWLRVLLTVDAVGCVVLGLVAVAAAGSIDKALGAEAGVLLVGGAALLVYAVEALVVARRPGRRGLLALALLNGGFAVGAGAVVLTGSLTTLGLVVAAALATVSLVAAELLLVARRGTTTA